MKTLDGPYRAAEGHCDEEERAARAECARCGIDPDELCADGGIEAWMVVAQEMRNGIKRK
jgi:hypothetical protein